MSVSELYYKINELRAKNLRLSEIFDKFSTNGNLLIKKMQQEFGPLFPVIAEQIKLLEKAKKKLPTWVENNCFFETTAFEQCTSEKIAKLKASLFSGKTLLNLSGGLGSDDFAFSLSFEKIISIDFNPLLHHLWLYNQENLSINNIQRICSTAEEFLLQNQFADTIVYVDPDRRKNKNIKTQNPFEFSPNIFELIPKYISRLPFWIIKFPGNADLSFLEKNIPLPKFNTVILAEKGEIKEILLHNLYKSDKITIYDLTEMELFCWNGAIENIDIQKTKVTCFAEFKPIAIKSNFYKKLIPYAQKTYLNSQIFVISNCVFPESLARNFNYINQVSGSLNSIKKALHSSLIYSATITARECIIETEELYKILSLKKGQDFYLFIFNVKTTFTCIIAQKIKTPPSLKIPK